MYLILHREEYKRSLPEQNTFFEFEKIILKDNINCLPCWKKIGYKKKNIIYFHVRIDRNKIVEETNISKFVRDFYQLKKNKGLINFKTEKYVIHLFSHKANNFLLDSFS